jgi:PAS domain S-box-containing protein
LAVCATLVGLALAFLISDQIYMKGFEKLETQSVERNTHRAEEALKARLDALNTFCSDWAVWDDTYQFAQEYNQGYVDRNFQAETFKNSDVNLITILNSAGEIVYVEAYDFINEKEIALPGDFASTISESGLEKQASVEDGVSGIINFFGQPMMIVSRQVLTSVNKGPSTGVIIMGRFIDSEVIDGLSATTNLPITMLTAQNAGDKPEFKSVLGHISPAAPVYVKEQDKKEISGYALVNDLRGNPSLVFKIDRPRDIYAQGLKATAIMHSSLLLVGIFVCSVSMFLSKKYIFSRVSAISKSVSDIAEKGDVSGRITATGNDELSRLAGNINNMLESLENSEGKRRSQRELISHILANTLNAILAVNKSEEIVLANPAFTKLFGLERVTLTGKNIVSLSALDGIVPEIRAFLKGQSLNSKAQIEYGYNGVKKSFVANFSRMNDEELSFMILTDVTEERTRQERLYLTDRLASVGEMAAGIAHELNNPLTGIIGLSEILAEDNAPVGMKEDLVLIHSEAQRAAGIVKSLLSFARKHTPRKQHTKINRVIEDVLKLRSHEQRVTEITVETKLAPDLPEIMVDYFQIQQVFINIIMNAEQAMKEKHGKGKLLITTEKVADVIRISFTDDGPGIEPQCLKRVFDPFFTTKEVGKGTGLGLSICYGIINEHKGRIYAESTPGSGATFIVELPVKSNLLEGISRN